MNKLLGAFFIGFQSCGIFFALSAPSLPGSFPFVMPTKLIVAFIIYQLFILYLLRESIIEKTEEEK